MQFLILIQVHPHVMLCPQCPKELSRLLVLQELVHMCYE